MNGIVVLVALFVVFGLVLAVIAFVAYRRVLRRAKGVERGLKMVPLLIHLPPPSDDTENSGSRDVREVMREKISQAQVLYDLIAGTAQTGFKSNFYGQRHIAFEIVASNGLVHYFAAVPIALVSLVEQAVVTAYPGARLEEVEDHNIFNPQGRLTGTVGGELVLRHDAAYPIAVLDQMERDPMVGILNALSKLQLGEGAAIQIMLRPANPNWVKRAAKVVAKKRHTRQGGLGFTAGDLAKAAVKNPEEWRENAAKFEPSKLEETMLQAIEDKAKHPGYEVLVRVLASAPTYDRAQSMMRSITTAFALFEAPGSNGFQLIEGRDMQGLVTAFIFRFFPPEITSNVLNSVELATLFHLPDAQFTPTTQVQRQQSKQVDGPVNMSANGLLLGYNFYRGVKKEIRLSPEDRRRHTYIIGQTGTGKSTILENLAVQDMLAGNGFAFIDPHGDTAEKLISMVPKERAEDVIYFNPGDMEHPLGLNLFEFSSPEQKDFLIQESINMLYKLYDPGKTGIIGPRFEHWYRNAALTLMADPHGASFIEIPKVFTDSAYLKDKFKYLTDPTVIDFWTKEMGQTSDYHKSEMLGFFVSKFGAFQSNEMMRNIIGQTKSGFNLRDIMDNKKILIVNLGKGSVGELNSQLLGMMFVMKFQAAAMSRAKDTTEPERQDFCLYVDEFQNFSTDSFATILSEARKYRLNLIVANQFIGQLSDEIREAVFGNVGTMLSFRCGPEDAEFLVKQFQPVFDVRDLVNLPNYNAVMKLLMGGLPSQPFSVTMLPPLGQAHVEMGQAIKQLSAAKYGVPRATAEADIFARLQNQPRTVVPNAATAGLTPPPAATGPAVDAHAAMLPPAPSTSPATAPPAAVPAPLVAAPAPPVAAPPPPPPAVNPPDGLSLSQLRTTAPAPVAPPAPPLPSPTAPPPPPSSATPPSPAPAAPIVAPAPPPVLPQPPLPAPVPAPPSGGSTRISDIVQTPAAPSAATFAAEPALELPKPSSPLPPPAPSIPPRPPVPAPPIPPTPPTLPAALPPPQTPKPTPVSVSTSKPVASPPPLIEAREIDGRPAKDSQRRIEARETDGRPNVLSEAPLRIEAREADGKVQKAQSDKIAPPAPPIPTPPPPAPTSAVPTPAPTPPAAPPPPKPKPAPAPMVPVSAPVSAPQTQRPPQPPAQPPSVPPSIPVPAVKPQLAPQPVNSSQKPPPPAPLPTAAPVVSSSPQAPKPLVAPVVPAPKPAPVPTAPVSGPVPPQPRKPLQPAPVPARPQLAAQPSSVPPPIPPTPPTPPPLTRPKPLAPISKPTPPPVLPPKPQPKPPAPLPPAPSRTDLPKPLPRPPQPSPPPKPPITPATPAPKPSPIPKPQPPAIPAAPIPKPPSRPESKPMPPVPPPSPKATNAGSKPISSTLDKIPTPEAVAAEVAEVLSKLSIKEPPVSSEKPSTPLAESKPDKPAPLPPQTPKPTPISVPTSTPVAPPPNPQPGKTMIATHASSRFQGRKAPQRPQPAVVLPPAKPRSTASPATTSVPVPPPEYATVNEAYAAAATPKPVKQDDDSHYRSIKPPADFSLHPVLSPESAIDSVAMPAPPRPEAIYTPQSPESKPDLPVFVPDPLPQPAPAPAKSSLPVMKTMHKPPSMPLPAPKPQAKSVVPEPKWKPVPKPEIVLKPISKPTPPPVLPPKPQPKPPAPLPPTPPKPEPHKPQPAPKPPSTPPAPPVSSTEADSKPSVPDLKPGEIFVDEKGEVIQGE